MSWPRVPLGEVATLEREGIVPSSLSADTPYLGLEHIDGDGTLHTSATVGSAEVKSTKFRFCAEHVLFGKLRPYLRKIARPDFEGVCSTDILPIRPGKRLDRAFLFHFLRSPEMVSLATSRCSGANLPRLSPSQLEGFEVPIPPLDEQKRITAILDAADALRTKRRESIQQVDSLIEAAFLEMFGDPVTNPKGWEVRPLQDLGPLNRGVSTHRPRNEPGLLGGPHPLIQTGDVANSDGYIRRYSSTYSDLGLKQSRKWPAGTLCITIAANIASTGILTFESCFPDSVVGFLAGELSRVEYVRWVFQAFKSTLDSKATQVAQKNINLQTLRTLPVPCPPLDLQTRFAFIVNSIEQQKARLKAHLADLDALFASLQSRAFSGELCSPSFARQHASA